MEKIKNILTFKLKISHTFLILAFINIILCVIYFGKLGTFFVDISREVYIPMAMNNGDTLYKDIFNVYSPFGYQINAFMTKIFSNNLHIFYLLGYINSTFFICGLYLISRLFFKETKYQIPFYYCILMIFCAIYAVSITNYIFPYSYSMVYALTAFIWSLVCLLYYEKKCNKVHLFLSFLAFGASIAFKYEFIFFGLVLCYFFFKNTTVKEKIICILSLLTIPSISLGNLFLDGVTLNDLNTALNQMLILSKSTSVHNLYSFLGFIPNKSSCISIIVSFISFIVLCAIMILPIKIASKINKKIAFSIAIIVEIAILYFLKNYIFIENNAGVFNWIGIFSIIAFSIFLIKKHSNIDKNDKLFLILFISTLLISFKSIFYIAINSYGSYYLPLLTLCVLIFFTKYTKIITTKSTLYLIIFFSILFGFSNHERCRLIHNVGIPFEKGTIWVEDYTAEAIWKTYNYIKKETQKEDKILVMPEGAMLNYLTNRKSDNQYYYLLPSNVELFTEEEIVKNLENNLPDYIIMTPRSFSDYKETFFCDSFGQKICNLIPKYYENPILQKGHYEYTIAIYKKRHDKI